jgi:hypothetical protein
VSKCTLCNQSLPEIKSEVKPRISMIFFREHYIRIIRDQPTEEIVASLGQFFSGIPAGELIGDQLVFYGSHCLLIDEGIYKDN